MSIKTKENGKKLQTGSGLEQKGGNTNVFSKTKEGNIK